MSELSANFQICEVINVYDELGGDRIQAKPLTDSYEKNEGVPWAFPLLPKIIHVKPKVGESVLLFTIKHGENDSQRFYIGPIITQAHRMYNEPHNNESDRFFMGAYLPPDTAPTLYPNAIGSVPENDDITIEGRKNCGLQITDDDIRLKAGVKRLLKDGDETGLKFNRDDSAFIKLKYDESKPHNKRSTAFIVADNINILGNFPTGRTENFKTDNDTQYKRMERVKTYGYDTYRNTQYPAATRELITNKEIDKLLDDEANVSHRLPYGDLLVEFLKQFRDAFNNHTHPFPTMKPCQTDELKHVMEYDLDGILSNSVRIN